MADEVETHADHIERRLNELGVPEDVAQFVLGEAYGTPEAERDLAHMADGDLVAYSREVAERHGLTPEPADDAPAPKRRR